MNAWPARNSPRSSASSPVYPEVKMTGMPGQRRSISATSSRPPICGITTSAMTRSGGAGAATATSSAWAPSRPSSTV